jgi:glc operon protein GlcG
MPWLGFSLGAASVGGLVMEMPPRRCLAVKAKTAASYGKPTGDITAGVDLKLAIATRGKRINLPGGLPIIVDGHVIGGIGVGSAPSGEQDRQVAKAALEALPGVRCFD